MRLARTLALHRVRFVRTLALHGKFWGASVLASCQTDDSLFFETVAFAADGTGQNGADTLFEAGTVVAAHPAGECDGGIVDKRAIANYLVNRFELFDL